jgi:hypothetical protein
LEHTVQGGGEVPAVLVAVAGGGELGGLELGQGAIGGGALAGGVAFMIGPE